MLISNASNFSELYGAVLKMMKLCHPIPNLVEVFYFPLHY